MFARQTQASAPLLLTSPHNPLLKEIRRAIARGGLTDSGFAVAEGLHVVQEAIQSRSEIKALVAAESLDFDRSNFPGTEFFRVPDSLFTSLSSTGSPQGLMALVRPRQWELGDLMKGVPLLLVLDGIQDPGNAGGIVRSAEAFGATGVVLLKGSVSPFNPKAVRGSAGSVFRIPLLAGLEAGTFPAIVRGLQLYAAMPRSTTIIRDADLTIPCAIIIGSEGRGVSPALAANAKPVSIPAGNVESLNAGVAAAIFIYEASRQRNCQT